MSIAKARELRKDLTEAEQALWKHLRMRQLGNYKFRRQQAIGLYIVDFVSFEGRVVIELDGGQHSQQMDHDSKRTAWLESQGYRVLRFWNNQVLQEIEAVEAIVSKVLEDGVNTPHLNPPPQGGRRDNYRVASGKADF
jgi:very-short-patch-repair endonuclease